MRKLKQGLAMVLAATSAFGLFACGGNEDDGDKATKIVIYAGGSSEYSWVKGSEEDTVIAAVEEKYYQDRGIKLDFEINYMGEDMKTKLATEIAADESSVDIAISHARYTSGIDIYAIENDLAYNLKDLVEDYGENLYEYIEGDPYMSMMTADGKLIGIPSAINPYQFGILVRKDLMEAAGYTDDETKTELTYLDTLEEFEDMCKKIKQSNSKISYPITGAPWDWEKVLTLGAYADAGFFSNVLQTNATGKEEVVNGYMSDAYADVLKQEYDWVTAGLVSPEAQSILLETAESNFISGSSAVFVQDPTITHLIKVARLTKANNPEAEFTVLGPLKKDAESEKKGFMRTPTSMFAAVVLKGSKNAKAIVQFLDWVYEDKDNYELCRYGIKGTHWTDNGDGTYSYTNEAYLTKPPYSGILTLVENQNISNLTYAQYTAEEKAWIALAQTPENYLVNNAVDYLLETTNETLKAKEATATNNFYLSVAVPAWTGSADPLSLYEGTDMTMFELYRNQAYSHCLQYRKEITEQYQLLKQMRG